MKAPGTRISTPLAERLRSSLNSNTGDPSQSIEVRIAAQFLNLLPICFRTLPRSLQQCQSGEHVDLRPVKPMPLLAFLLMTSLQCMPSTKRRSKGRLLSHATAAFHRDSPRNLCFRQTCTAVTQRTTNKDPNIAPKSTPSRQARPCALLATNALDVI